MTATATEHRSTLSNLKQPVKERRNQPLRSCVQTVLEIYFADMDGHKPATSMRW